MKLVLDTNVLVAAFVSRGVCHELLEHCERGHEIITSEPLLREFEDVLVCKLKVPSGLAREARKLFARQATIVKPPPLESPVSRDADDDEVLATALAGGCRCTVSGDRDLLVLEQFQGIRILAPGGFWSYEAGESP